MYRPKIDHGGKTASFDGRLVTRRDVLTGLSACAAGCLLMGGASDLSGYIVITDDGWILRSDEAPEGWTRHA